MSNFAISNIIVQESVQETIEFMLDTGFPVGSGTTGPAGVLTGPTGPAGVLTGPTGPNGTPGGPTGTTGPTGSGSQNLAQVLTIGNSAGAISINLNGNSLRTSTGNITIDASVAVGGGSITLATKNNTLGIGLDGGELIISGNNTLATTVGLTSGKFLRFKGNDGLVYKIPLFLN